VPANLGLALRAEGDLDGARSMFEASLRISRQNGDTRGMAYGFLYLTCVTGDLGDWDRAAVLHGSVQAFQDRTGLPWDDFDARCWQDSLVQARARLGDERLERAYAQGTALSLEQALDLALTVPAARSGPAGSPAGPLSAREREIMALLAGGASNAKIAQTLFVTPNTVRTHLDRIRDKTGARNRAELTRYALQTGIEPVVPSA
jgi:DNA-binding CsgD family transcriptional regulator